MSDSTKIIKIRKDDHGDITDVMLENGNVFAINHAILLAKRHLIEGVNVTRGKDGGEYLQADPNDSLDDHLNDLPVF